MLRQDVIKAVEDKQFHVYAVEDIDQAIEVLTGIAAGEVDTSGKFPNDSINFRVEQKLLEMSQTREKFGKAKK